MLPPERRTRTDLLVAMALVATVLVAASVVWLRSDARGTTSITWDDPVTAPPTANTVPPDLSELWRSPSAATARALAVGGTAATADGTTVVGRDLLTGESRWSYERDRPLCAATAAWGTIVSVYPDRRGCGQVTALAADSGARAAQRTSNADDAVRLLNAGAHVISFGDTRLEMWRSDLVRTVEYGRVDAPVNPGSQPRTGCNLRSAGASGEVLAVLEQCPGEPTERLTLLDPTPEDSQKPEEFASSVLPEAAPGGGSRIVAVVEERVAVYLPPGNGAAPRIDVFDSSGDIVQRHVLEHTAGPDAGPAKEHDGMLVWWTGADTIALAASDFAPRWVVEDTLGTGDAMAGTLLLPVEGALAVVDPSTGDSRGRISVERGGRGPVSVTVAGDVVLEQRGSEIVALR
ncbi:Rv3212 family protein [Rhodococcus chondri]|uniref:Uncharacterized protein n=1 Tax=Rhodococcus chondri TaxID=3065941 RepID=A0ABU7JXA6_9NOCA|nr:hypothetical protein [Rhodococcus sp. CC-R104]MEE2034417.1 hypothetical protein [Rhodococcus sp. CC-R104]